MRPAYRSQSSVPFTYAVLGSGVQGVAAAYDLAIHGDANEIRLGDLSLHASQRAAGRLEALTDKNIFRPYEADVKSAESLGAFLAGVDVCLSCVPYHLHPLAAEAAIQAGCSLIDMGGDTEDALRTLARDEEAGAKGIAIVTDGGVAPGLINLLAAHLISQFETPEEAKLYCGGLPLDPKPPFHYTLAFNVEGLISEYADKAFGVSHGRAVEMDSLTDVETLEWPGLGTMEAATTSGGTGTAPFLYGASDSLTGQEAAGVRALARIFGSAGFSPLQTYEYRTLRFPGHWETMKLFRDLGFWGTEKVEIEDAPVAPRSLFEKLVGEFLTDPGYRDQVLLRVEVSGLKPAKPEMRAEARTPLEPATLRIDLHERYHEGTGFTAMQRMTGFPVAICAIELAHGRVRRGCTPFELSMPGGEMLRALQQRGIAFQFAEIS